MNFANLLKIIKILLIIYIYATNKKEN